MTLRLLIPRLLNKEIIPAPPPLLLLTTNNPLSLLNQLLRNRNLDLLRCTMILLYMPISMWVRLFRLAHQMIRIYLLFKMCGEGFCFFVGWFLGLFGIFHCWFEYYNIYYKHHGLYITHIHYCLPSPTPNYYPNKIPLTAHPQKYPNPQKNTNHPISNNSNIIITIIYFQKPPEPNP